MKLEFINRYSFGRSCKTHQCIPAAAYGVTMAENKIINHARLLMAHCSFDYPYRNRRGKNSSPSFPQLGNLEIFSVSTYDDPSI